MIFRLALLAASLALSACSSVPVSNEAARAPLNASSQKVAVTASGPPTTDGVYTYAGCEGEGGCPFQNWRTIEPTPLLERQIASARVIGGLNPGEWVHVEIVETRLVPRRGIVRGESESFRAGDIVYALEYEGEGFTSVWRRGEISTISDDVPVDWEDKPASPTVAATLGLWAKVKRENGQTGWVHDPKFECMGQLAGDEGCRN